LKFWWYVDTVRCGAEWRSVEALARDEGWFQLDRWRIYRWNLCAEGVISAHEHSYPVRLVYPDQFPEVPAWVEPQNDFRWTHHQYGHNLLCLEYRPDNWTPTMTGVDVLCSAQRLLLQEDPLGEGGTPAPSAHHIGEVQAFNWGASPILIGAACVERIKNRDSIELNALMWALPGGSYPILVYDSHDRQTQRRPPEPDFLSLHFDVPAFASLSPAPSELADRAALISAGGIDAERLDAIPTPFGIVVLFVADHEIIAYHAKNDAAPSRRRVFVLPEQSGIRSGRSPGVDSKQVAIVGAGSVGSKIAECLLRSGITRLKLVDGDVLLPDNLERHTLDWRDIGLRKVEAVKRRLLHIVPGADIEILSDNLNWQRSAQVHAWQVLAFASCDIVVDATGDAPTSLFLGAVADANARPFVSVEVFEGGIGGLIATCVPPRDPSFVEGRAAFLAWCEERGAPPPDPGPRRYEVLGDDGTPMTADDASVTTTAGHAARSILDIMDGAPVPAPSAWLLLGYRPGWLFDCHGHTFRINVGEREAPTRVGEDAEAKSFVKTLLQDAVREAEAEA